MMDLIVLSIPIVSAAVLVGGLKLAEIMQNWISSLTLKGA